jgi:hypothetical protein
MFAIKKNKLPDAFFNEFQSREINKDAASRQSSAERGLFRSVKMFQEKGSREKKIYVCYSASIRFTSLVVFLYRSSNIFHC